MRHGRWPGTWKVVCDVCGFEFSSDVVKKRWDGLITCSKDWESDHPQKYIRVRSDETAPPFVRSEPEDQFVVFCTILTSQGVADLGTADCARADIVSNATFN